MEGERGKTTPIFLLGPVSASPSMSIVPPERAMMPAMIFSTVLLPQPEGPTTETNSFSPRSKFRSRSASMRPPRVE